MPEPSLPTAIIVIPIVLAMLMVCLVMIKPSILKDGGGQIVGFCALFLLPISVDLMGGLIQSDQAQTTEYCLSCHIMDDWGKSLHVDDNEFVPADHFQNYLVPQDRSCYVCHSDQVWYGGITAKIRVALNMCMFSISGIRRSQRILNCTTPTTTVNVCSVIRAPGAMRKAGIIGKKQIC